MKGIKRRASERGGGTEWIAAKMMDRTDDCFVFPFSRKYISWLGKVRSPAFVTCLAVNGPPVDERRTPIRTCSTHKCINGKHQRWGTVAEAMALKREPRRDGEHNPKAKLTAEIVMQLRSVNWWNSYVRKDGTRVKTGLSRLFRKEVCLCLEIERSTLSSILHNHSWKDVQYEEGLWLGDTRAEAEGSLGPIRYTGRPYWLDEGYEMYHPTDWEIMRLDNQGDEF